MQWNLDIRNTNRALKLLNSWVFFTFLLHYTVEPVLKDHPIVPINMVSQDWWSLMHGSGLSRLVSLYLVSPAAISAIVTVASELLL